MSEAIHYCQAHPWIRMTTGTWEGCPVCLTARVIELESREASVCPEDVGIVEYVGILRASVAELEEKYHELIYAVGNRYREETRHQTALRYIREAESRDPSPEAASEIPQPK